MERFLVATVIVVVAVAVALVLRRRQQSDAPTQARAEAPTQLDRRDFPGVDAEWLLVVFSSATCATCADVVQKAKVVESPAVAVVDVEWSAARDLHARYAIDAVPITVLADRDGVVRATFLGPVSASELWNGVAAARDPQ